MVVAEGWKLGRCRIFNRGKRGGRLRNVVVEGVGTSLESHTSAAKKETRLPHEDIIHPSAIPALLKFRHQMSLMQTYSTIS